MELVDLGVLEWELYEEERLPEPDFD